MISRIHTAVLNGLEVVHTEVEVGFTQGVPGIVIVGLPDNAVKESRERLKLAIRNSRFEYPAATKVVINLSPADVRKEGASLDLPMAVGILCNQWKLEHSFFNDALFFGELNLNGDVSPVKGVLNFALWAREKGFRAVVVPRANAREAAFVKGLEVYAVANLVEAVQLVQEECIRPYVPQPERREAPPVESDFREIRGQYLAKRAMEIAAAGFHNVLLIGPPGSGKSMISRALPSILPEMSEEETLETSLIYSAAGLLNGGDGLVTTRPFRDPHHTISDVGLAGGGKYPVPGEISLAHNGVLFLDELPYFKKTALEVLRQPLEDGRITISRSLSCLTFPARFMLVAAMNPCEDASAFSHTEFGRPSDIQKRHYYAKLSRPLLDRIDLQIEVHKVKLEEITAGREAECSARVKERVVQARARQTERFRGLKRRIFANGQMKNPEIRRFCALDAAGEKMLKTAVERFNLSARGYFKVLKLARTIADLAGSAAIAPAHLQEALQYRSLDLTKF